MPYSSESMNMALPATPTNEASIRRASSYRGNVEGCDPQTQLFTGLGPVTGSMCSEAPIDLLAFLTLYPEDWQQHSYVALCGTAEHAMLWMLEQNPKLQKIILCLDHDAAGIEAGDGSQTFCVSMAIHSPLRCVRPTKIGTKI